MLQIKKVERFDMPTECNICGEGFDVNDPYKFTFDDRTSMVTCDTCGKNICNQFRIEEADIKCFYLYKGK